MTDDTIEDDLRQLRYLTQALQLVADSLEEKHESEAVAGIAWEMGQRIEAVEAAWSAKARPARNGRPKLVSQR
jgi:hypothetical protein